jgi:hypothetical protein
VLTRLRANDVDEGLSELPGLMLEMRDGMKEGKKYSTGSTRGLESRRSRGIAGCACLTMWLASYSTYRSVTLEVYLQNGGGR